MDNKFRKNKYDRIMSRVQNRSRPVLKSSNSITRHDIPTSVHVGAKPSVSKVSSTVYSELPTVLHDYVTEISREKLKGMFVSKPRKTLTSLDPALSPPRPIHKPRELPEKTYSLRGVSALSFFGNKCDKWSDSHYRECLSSRSHTRIKELKDEIKAYNNIEKHMKLRSRMYKNCGIVLDDFGNVATDKAVQVENLQMPTEGTIYMWLLQKDKY